MFVIDYLKSSSSNRIVVPPFHSGHLGLMPRSAAQTVTLLQSAHSPGGCEICITPYDRPLTHLFRLKCVLREQTGVVHRLLRAIAAMGINILSWESTTLESNGGHGVFMLLDWTTTSTPHRVSLSPNLQDIFFPRLSGIIPSNDLRYVRLLRQILGQCADVLHWEGDQNSDMALPRLRLSEFEENRMIACRGEIHIETASTHRVHLDDAGVALEIHPQVAAQARVATGRDEGAPLHYILLSDIESKTLRVFIPRHGRERRMIHLGFSHKNLPGALCAITEFIARNRLSIISGLVRKLTSDRNILEVTLEHEHADLPMDRLISNPRAWANERLPIEDAITKQRLRYYAVTIEAPRYPRDTVFRSTPLYDGAEEVATTPLQVVTADEAEHDVASMASRMAQDASFSNRRWLTDLLFSPDWGPHGKPSIFLSYPSSGAGQAASIRTMLTPKFKIRDLQDANAQLRQDGSDPGITQEAIRRIVESHFFIGIWHHEKDDSRALSPWMPFEYGVALSHNKPCILLCHKDVDPRFTKRIMLDTGRMFYSDLVQEPHLIRDLELRCEQWYGSYRRLSL